MEPSNPALDDYVLSLSPRPEPRICLLPTAGGDSREQIARFQSTFGDKLCRPSYLSLFRLAKRPTPLRETILAQDIVYVGGGSMRNLLAIWREHHLDAILAEAWRHGVVLCGISAGSMCWFQSGITTSLGPPTVAAGLGLLPGSNCVHYDGEPGRRPVYLDAVRSGAVGAGYGVDDGVGLLFTGSRLAEIVASREGARAYRVTRGADGEARETELGPRVLAAPDAPQRGVPFDISEYRLAREARRARQR